MAEKTFRIKFKYNTINLEGKLMWTTRIKLMKLNDTFDRLLPF
jgi:hypothetical protein